MTRYKFIVVDKRHRAKGTYKHDVHELDAEDGPSDPLEAGQTLHDHLYGEEDTRFFVKVLGVEDED